MAIRSIEEAKTEAVKRLEVLKVHENVRNEFLEEKLNKSEHNGALYWLKNEEKVMVEEFEKKNEAIVFHIIHQNTNIGELYNLLYVSLDDLDWELDCEDLAEGQILAYVINNTFPDCTRFGCIGVKPLFGGITRIW